MKIYRFEHAGRIRLGIEFGSVIYDVISLYEMARAEAPEVVRKADVKTLCAAPDSVVVFLTELLKTISPVSTPDNIVTFIPGSVRILAPIPKPGKFICIGLNYKDHCEEQNLEPPKNPVLFAKFANAVCGHMDAVEKPDITNKLDYEGELAVVIGMGGKRISRDRALQHVFGYTIVNDISAREVQKNDGQWVRAKSQDSFAPIGPCIVTSSEIPDPQTLGLQTRVNGQLVQDSNTSRMIFPVAELIEFITRGMTLEPGDIISTGTPCGVGVHRKPPLFLNAGDRVDITIDKIGTLSNTIV